VLFSRDSDPALCAPSGHSVSVLRRPDLGQLDTTAVMDVLAATVPEFDRALAPG
jgi:hypothetical protein